MNFLKLYVDAFKRILDFNGRANRTTFWAFILISMVVSLILGMISVTIANIYAIVALVAGIALSIRRGRDAGTPWLALLLLIPLLGLIILGVLPRK